MTEPRIRNFEDFWPYYVRAHTEPNNRLLHAIGTTCAMGCVGAAVLTVNPLLLALAPVVGYGFAWMGHFMIEGNRPATFGFPMYSLRADFKMLWLTLRGAMDDEVRKHARDRAATANASA